MLFIWCFMFPFIMILVLQKKFEIIKENYNTQVPPPDTVEQEEKQIKQRYLFFFSGFRIENLSWEFVILYRKVDIILVADLLWNVSPETQCLAVLVLLTINLTVHLSHKPYVNTMLNFLESFSLISIMLNVYAGMYFISADIRATMDPEASEWVFIVTVMVPNALFVLIWLYYIRIEFLKYISRNHDRWFRLASCFCNSKAKFDEENRVKQLPDEEGDEDLQELSSK